MNSLIEVEKVRDSSQLISCRSVAPLRLIQTARSDRVQVTLASYGGGMVQGDRVGLDIRCGPDSRLTLTTQSNTQVYENNGGFPARQIIRGKLDKNSSAEILPSANVLHKNARFIQEQEWDLANDATLVLTEIFQSGRIENKECFEFDEYRSDLVIRREGKVLCDERSFFRPKVHDQATPARFGPYHVLMNLYLIGPRTEELIRKLRNIQNEEYSFSLPQAKAIPDPYTVLYELPAPQAFVFRALAGTQLALQKLLDIFGLE